MSPIARVRRLAGARRSRDTAWSMVAELVQVALSSVVFFVLARSLGPADLGRYSAILAVSIIVGHLVHAGAHPLFLIETSAGRPVAEQWRVAFRTLTTGGALGALIVLALQPLLVPGLGPVPYLAIVIAWLNLQGIVDLCVTAALVSRRLDVCAWLRIVNAVVRSVALVGFFVIGDASLVTWAYVGLVGAVAAAILVLALTAVTLGLRPAFALPRIAELRAGIPFALGGTSEGFLDASDRPIMLANGYAVDAGRYAIGYRVVQLGLVPLVAICRATDAELFGAARRGAGDARRVAVRILRPATAVTAAAGAGMFLAAPLLVDVLGAEYDGSVTVVRVLAVLPLIKAFQYLAGNALMAAGYPTSRFRMTLVAALLNLVLNLALIPRWSWRGAVATTLVAELVLTAGLWLLLHRRVTRERRLDARIRAVMGRRAFTRLPDRATVPVGAGRPA